MNTGCNCFGIAASSRVPRKGYNKLVPPVFPKDPPISSRPDQEQERQLQALIAYLAATPDCISKVSRRLARAVNASLVVIASQPLAAREMLQGFAADPGMAPGPTAVVTAEAGHVRLAVQTYTRLLGSLSTCDCSLLAQELICTKPSKADSPVRVVALPAGTGGENHIFSVVGVLLTHAGWQMRAQGLLLLSAFMASQADDTFLRPVEKFLSYVCTAATRAVGRVAAAAAAFNVENGSVDVKAPKGRREQAEQNDIQEVRETMATLAGFLQLLHRAASTSRYLLLVQRTVMEALQQIHEASHQHALSAATAASGQGGRQALLLTPDDPLHGMYAMPEAWHACEALGQLIEIEVLAEGVVSDMVGFMWQHRCWGMATQVAGLKADFMTIFVEVATASRRTVWLFEMLLKQAAALSSLGTDFSDNEFAGLLGTLVAVADQGGLLQGATAAHILSLVLQAAPLMAAGAKPEAHAAIQDVSTLAVSYVAGMCRRSAVVAAVGASLGCLQRICGRDSVEVEVGLSLMTVACMQMEGLPPHQLEPDIWESLLPRQLALQLARLFKTACLPARTAAHALLGAMFQKTATQLPSPQAALLLSAIWHEAALKENTHEAYEGMQAVLVEVVERCPPDALPYALQCLLALRLEVAKGASLQLSQHIPSLSLVMLSQELVDSCNNRALRAQLGPAHLCCLLTMTQAAALGLMGRCGLQPTWQQCPTPLDPCLFSDEKAAGDRLREEVGRVSQGQAQQDGCLEELCRSPGLLAATGLDAAGLQDILQQPFCPAPILSADPCWQLPKVRQPGFQIAGRHLDAGAPIPSAATKQGSDGKPRPSKPRTRKGSKAKKVAQSIASTRSWRNLDTGVLETGQSHTALPSFEDLVMVVKDAKLHPEGCSICIIEPASPGGAKKASQDSRPSQGSRPPSFDGTSAAIKHRTFLTQARSCKQTTEECRQILQSTRKLAEEGAKTDAIPAVALDIFCHAAKPPRS